MTLIQEYLEVVDTPVWDTLYLWGRHSFESQKMFVVPYGGTVDTREGPRLKTFLDTNLSESGQLYTPQSFAVRRLRCALSKSVLPGRAGNW
jgi:hypothetical protein